MYTLANLTLQKSLIKLPACVMSLDEPRALSVESLSHPLFLKKTTRHISLV